MLPWACGSYFVPAATTQDDHRTAELLRIYLISATSPNINLVSFQNCSSGRYPYPWGHDIYPFCIVVCKGICMVVNFFINVGHKNNILSKPILFLWQLGKIYSSILYKKTHNKYSMSTKTLIFLQCPYVLIMSIVPHDIGICLFTTAKVWLTIRWCIHIHRLIIMKMN